MNKLKYLTDAAMTTAIAIAILLISHVTGLEIEELFPFLIPIPVALYTMRYGFVKGLIPMIAISSLSLAHNPLHGLFFVLSGNLIGLLYGLSLYKTKKQGVHVTIAVLGSVVINVLTMLVFSQLLYGYSIYDEISSVLQALFQKIPELNEETKIMVEAISKGLVPSIIAIMSLLEGVLFHYVTLLLSKRIFQHETDQFSFQKIRFPLIVNILFCVVSVIVFGTIVLYQQFPSWLRTLWEILLNVIITFSLVYLLISLVYFSRLAREKNKMWIYLLACLFIVLFPLHVINGVVQSFISYHREKKKILHRKEN